MTTRTDMSPTKQAWAAGGTIFAATLMVVLGIFHILIGIAAIARETFFAVSDDYLYLWNATAWGWIHLIAGIIVALAGFALYTGQTWARAVAITLAVISAVANFFFIPYYPFWALLLIAMDVFIIWAVATEGSRERQMMGGSAMAGGYGGGYEQQSRERWPQENVATGRQWAEEPAKGSPDAAQRAAQEAQEAARSGRRNPPPGTTP
ncbi:MAG TPA: hypothetical protein VK028_05255 [Micromonosporaceae bacterium]|nr:hypothetical protein [Micromonosporaceae bacterium]